jgi:hypothetical protein
MAQPQTAFNWSIYADATFAGLAVLIPIPLVDRVFEEFFRRRIATRIARHRGRQLHPAVLAELNRGDQSCLTACLMLPITLTFGLIARLSRKLLYFLTVKSASDQLSYYWQRAFLIDFMLGAGHLDTPASAQVARMAMEQVLRTTRTPLTQLASQVTSRARHVLPTLRRARRDAEDELVQETRMEMDRSWSGVAVHLQDLALRYQQAYQQLLTQPAALPPG